ncbi:common central domain of tyrosinase-domain-containing protein [Irpex lacteus]|nr:common central domain of tyrosinase-domain-containing protein [Irpex lacteus]
MASISITGVQDTSVHSRREIHELVGDTRQFSLFVQALLHMQEMDPEDPTLYYALAGIHGCPYQPWPASHLHDADTTKKRTQWLWYCTHGTVLFPTWHRPHILALEQHIHATHLASLYTTPTRRPSRRLAAQSLRMPYWDWALHPLPPPEVIEYETVWVTTCREKREEVRNPTFSFVFTERVRGEEFPKRYKGWGRTVRWPMDCEGDAKADVEALKRALSRRNAQQTQAVVYRMLVNVHTWTEFSNHNSPLCSCSCTSTTAASTTATSSLSSPSSPSQSTTTSFPEEQHHTIKHHEDDTDDENEQDMKKVPGEFNSNTSPSCSCSCASTTCTSSSTSSSRSPFPSQPAMTSHSSSSPSRCKLLVTKMRRSKESAVVDAHHIQKQASKGFTTPYTTCWAVKERLGMGIWLALPLLIHRGADRVGAVREEAD